MTDGNSEHPLVLAVASPGAAKNLCKLQAVSAASRHLVDIGCIDRRRARLSDDEIKELIETQDGNTSTTSLADC